MLSLSIPKGILNIWVSISISIWGWEAFQVQSFILPETETLTQGIFERATWTISPPISINLVCFSLFIHVFYHFIFMYKNNQNWWNQNFTWLRVTKTKLRDIQIHLIDKLAKITIWAETMHNKTKSGINTTEPNFTPYKQGLGSSLLALTRWKEFKEPQWNCPSIETRR